MAVNIYDVAKLSGVSIATVSRVVNGSTKVSEKTRRKVLDVMEQCGYTPNVFARGLGLDSMKTIGILCPDISDAFIAQAVAFLEERLHQYEYDVFWDAVVMTWKRKRHIRKCYCRSGLMRLFW